MGILRGALETLKGLVKGQWHEGYYLAKKQEEFELILRFYGIATKDGQYGDLNFKGIQNYYWTSPENVEKYGKKLCYRIASKLIHPLKMGSFLLMDDFVMERLLKVLPTEPLRVLY